MYYKQTEHQRTTNLYTIKCKKKQKKETQLIRL